MSRGPVVHKRPPRSTTKHGDAVTLVYRSDVYQAILEHPGITELELVKLLKTTPGTILQRLWDMEKTGWLLYEDLEDHLFVFVQT